MPHMPVLSYETIADDLIVCTSQLHRFGTDAVLLTEFSEYRQKDRVCDLGTGCGIIPILMQRTAPPREIYAVDIQPEAIAQMCQGIAESMGIGSVLHPVCTDLKELWDGAPLGQLDLVTCNPPYKAYQAGIESQLTAQKLHGTRCCATSTISAARQNGCCGSAADSASATARNGWQTAWMPCGKTASNQSGCSLWRKRRTHSRGCSCWRAEAAASLFLNVLPQRIVGDGSGVTTRI